MARLKTGADDSHEQPVPNSFCMLCEARLELQV